jgi:hypothetical protein
LCRAGLDYIANSRNALDVVSPSNEPLWRVQLLKIDWEGEFTFRVVREGIAEGVAIITQDLYCGSCPAFKLEPISKLFNELDRL